jgi:membrane protease YdiL (CAAX protease family)
MITVPQKHRRGTPIATPQREMAGGPALTLLVFLHLAPGLIFTAFVVGAASALDGWGIEPSFALFGGIGLVLVPLELAYLAAYARRTTGSWSPLAAVDYRNTLPLRRLALLAGGLAIWFLMCLAASIALLEEWLITNLFSWMPQTLLQFSVVEEDTSAPTGVTLVALFVIALTFNGIAGPITEEMYFRGHLLPRLERYGRWAPVVNTVLFASYHFFSPWRYPAIVLGFLPITWMAWRTRSVVVSIATHMLINTITVLMLLASASG